VPAFLTRLGGKTFVGEVLKKMLTKFNATFDLLLNQRWWKFQWRYFRHQTPWDTGITPPEVMAFIAQTSPGKALDFGCGTGTNAITLARHGWQVTGVDFAEIAVRKARRKAKRAGLRIEFHTADVTHLWMLTRPFDYALDIGCLFTLSAAARGKYARELCRLIKPKGIFMLYAWLPRKWAGKLVGITPEEVDYLLCHGFAKIKSVIGEEKGHPSAWYWFERNSIRE